MKNEDAAPPPGADYRGVLIVDDDVFMGRAIERLIGAHRPVYAGGAKAALEQLGKQRFAVVLCDLDLRSPGEGGDALYRAVQADDPGQAERFVFMSGDAERDEFEAFIRSVSNRRLDKPFAPEALLALMDEMAPIV